MTQTIRRFPSLFCRCCPVRCSLSARLHQRGSTVSVGKRRGVRLGLVSGATTDDAAAPTTTQMPASDAEVKDEAVVGDVVTPSVFNKPWLRTTAVAGTLLLASQLLQRPLPGEMLKLTHFFAFAAWFGASIWVLLLSPKLMFTTLGRRTFGKLQAKLFPQYFGFSVLTLVVLLGTKSFSAVPVVLLTALFATCVNWLWLEPEISSRAMKRYALESAEERDTAAIEALMKETSKFHGMSSAVALVTLCCCIAYGFALASSVAI